MKVTGKMIKYKLTNKDGYTRHGQLGETLWEAGKNVIAIGQGCTLCTEDVVHFYDTPIVAAFMNPFHACISNPLCWKIEVNGVVAHDGTKGGTKSAIAIQQVPLPEISTAQRIKTAIYCALEVHHEPRFATWAEKWLSGEDRTVERASEAAHAAAEAAAEAAAAAVVLPPRAT